jgi:hypothetical protein
MLFAPPPFVTLNETGPMTNRLGSPFVDPGATALNVCAELWPLTTNGAVNSALASTYQLLYIAGNPPDILATNKRTVLVIEELPLVVSVGKLLANGTFQFSFNGPSGQPYRALATTNLVNPDSWSVVLSVNFGAQLAVVTETNVFGQSARFYRLVSP